MTEVERYRHALALCQAQRNAAQDAVINLGVELEMLRAELAALRAQREEPKPELRVVGEAAEPAA